MNDTNAPFTSAAADYAQHGIATFPCSRETKKPLVKRPACFGINASVKLADQPKWQDVAANIGFWCGSRSGITVVDIDTLDDQVREWALERFGAPRIIVRTGSGKSHLWYRHTGERRMIRPFGNAWPIDILGRGLVIAPPSIHPRGGRYRFVQGSLGDVPHLEAISSEAIPPRSSGTVREQQHISGASIYAAGERNSSIFKKALQEAALGTDQGLGIQKMLEFNRAHCQPPLPDEEVRRACASAWRYQDEGRNWARREPRAIITKSEFEKLAPRPDALLLEIRLKLAHGARQNAFAISPKAMAASEIIPGWKNPKRYRAARNQLEALERIRRVKNGGRRVGDPHLFQFVGKGDASAPNITSYTSSSLPSLPSRNPPASESARRRELRRASTT